MKTDLDKMFENYLKNIGKLKEEPIRKDIGEQNNNSEIEFDPNLQINSENENIATLVETQKTYNPKI